MGDVRMKNKLLNKRGEGYIDIVVTVLVIAFVLVFAISIFSVVTAKQDLKYMCSELIDCASVNGGITTEVDQRFRELCAETGITPTVQFSAIFYDSASGKVQLGDTITCTLTYNATLPGFGNFIFPLQVGATESGLSRVYWK